MSKGITKKVKKVVKPAVEELEKIGEAAKTQITGQQESGSLMDEVMTRSDGKTPDVSLEEERKLEQEKHRALQRIQEEARYERQKVKEKEAERLRRQQEVIQQPGEPVLPPLDKPLLPSSPKKGPALPGVVGKDKVEIKGRGK